MKYEDIIYRYICNQMTPEEEDSFIQQCKENNELREEALTIACLIKSLQNNG